MQIPQSSVLRALQGVAQATKSTEEEIAPVAQWVSSHAASLKESNGTSHMNGNSTEGLCFNDWHSAITSNPTNLDETFLHLASLAVAISFLRETCRQDQAASSQDLDECWAIIRDALASKNLSRPLFTAARSAQGLLSVPLCSLLRDGSIDELFRLHVWMPDGKRGNPDFLLHSHQPFAQSWILAGEARDHAYQVDAVADAAEATNAGYALAWSDGKGPNGASYKTHQAYSVVRNTGELFRAAEVAAERHVRGDTYTIPAAAFHRTEVAPDALHATLFFFDSHRGFVKDAGVLGPRDGDSYTQLRDPAGITPAELAEAVEAVRSKEIPAL